MAAAVYSAGRAAGRICRGAWKALGEVDPLRCLRCGGSMRIISFIREPRVIDAILRHLRSKGRDPRALPEHQRPPP